MTYAYGDMFQRWCSNTKAHADCFESGNTETGVFSLHRNFASTNAEFHL
jgi:hypothetical protein